MVNIPAENIKGIECKHVAYQQSIDRSPNDMLLVKEVVHTKDGQQIPRIKLMENFKRPVYVTKKPYRNHEDKKEYEELSKLDRYDCTQAGMSVMLQKALGWSVPNPTKQLREVCRSPYIYNADFNSTTIVKAAYKRKWPNAVSLSKVAVLDIETDVIYGTGEPIMVAITMGEHKVIAFADWWAERVPSLKEQLLERYRHHLSNITTFGDKRGEYIERNLIEETGDNLIIIDDVNIGEGFRQCMELVHTWMPDFLAIWNIDFDLPHLLRSLDKYNIPYEDVFVDPSVPDRYRKVWYRQARAQRETNSKSIAQHPADLWHVLFCLAGFYVVDAMGVFKKIRTAQGNEPDYKLENVLQRHLGVGKLRIPECKTQPESGLPWHEEMQRDFPVDYAVYCLFDCISIELLDQRTNDLAVSLPVLCGVSDFAIYPSLPKRLVDNLTLFYRDRNLIPGCVGADITTAEDEGVISMSEWIVTLPAYMVELNGINCVEEIPELTTTFRVQTADDDITQAYPTGEVILNVSKETTCIELCDIEGVSEEARRRQGINLTGGQTNAIEICNELLNMPYIDNVLDLFKADMEANLI